MDFIQLLFKEIREKHIEEYATSCAYYTILSFIPLMMLILTLTKYMGLERQSLFFILEQFLPANFLNHMVLEIIKEVYSKSYGTITFSAIFLLWSARKGMLALFKGLHAIYQVKEKKKTFFYQLKALFVTAFFTVLILFTLLVLALGNSIYLLMQEKLNTVNEIVSFFLKFRTIFFTLFFSIFLTLLYYISADKRYDFGHHILGAIIAAITCTGITNFYGMYIDCFKGFSVLYGSLTSLILAMMWIYGCMYSILVGGMMNQLIGKCRECCNKNGSMIQ